MSQVLSSESNLTNIANSIRAKLGVQTTYKPSEMSGAIDSISGGGSDTDFIKFIEGGMTTINLPSSATQIKSIAFDAETLLQTIDIPSPVLSIGNSAFYGCRSLTTVTFHGTPNTIYSNAFSSCTQLTTIRVPWASGAVANAPWGATNATIVYNYTS